MKNTYVRIRFVCALVLCIAQGAICFAQNNTLIAHYEAAYSEIQAMLSGEQDYSFKRAVFLVENAYYENSLVYDDFNEQIAFLKSLANDFRMSNEYSFEYDFPDREKILVYASVFKVMTDTIYVIDPLKDKVSYHLPFIYDFYDVFGANLWEQMFVNKLLRIGKGNCHSLPYLYKILVEEFGERAHLALAPNHIYIKHQSKKMGMYNTELTSATFPIDAWLMASGYVHLDAIRSAIFMDTLSDKQTLALCLIDLAQGYKRKFRKRDKFVKSCIETALEYYPNYINALLLKSEILKAEFDKLMRQNGAEYPKDIFHIPEAKSLFDEYESLVVKIYTMGFRKMPKEMYLDWLLDLQTHKQEYLNPKVSTVISN